MDRLDIIVIGLSLVVGLFYGFWGRDAVDYPNSDKPDIKLVAKIHVFVYHFLGGFVGAQILWLLFQDIYLENAEMEFVHGLMLIIGFMGVMGFLPRLIGVLSLDPQKVKKIRKHLL